MNKSALILMMLLTVRVTFANNLGNYGQVFPILEKDIRQVLMHRLHEMEISGELKRRQREVINRVAEHIIRPKPSNLSTTTTPKSFLVDPSVMVNQDIVTPDGNVVIKAGARLNPFEHITFSKTLLFFNADDKHQVAWIKHHYQDYSHVKFILTGGDIRESYKIFGRVYFDLGGQLSNRLHLKHVPSVVYQNGLSWKILEIGVPDE